MTTKTEALESVLEALERVINCCDINECMTVPHAPGSLKNARLAITKAKEALAQPEQEPLTTMDTNCHDTHDKH